MLWSTGNASIRVAPVGGGPSNCLFDLKLSTVVPRHIEIWMDSVQITQAYILPNAHTQLTLELPQEGAMLRIKTAQAAAPPGNGDPRLLAFSMFLDNWAVRDGAKDGH